MGWYTKKYSPFSRAPSRSIFRLRWSATASCIDGRNTTALFLPMPFARYIAMSASRSRSSGTARTPSATPMLAETVSGTSLPEIWNGVRRRPGSARPTPRPLG